MALVEPERVQDTLSVYRFFSLYARAADSRDWRLYKSLFTEDAVLDFKSGFLVHGVNTMGGVCGSRELAASWIEEQFKSFGTTQHMMSNIDITWDGEDTAHVRAMLHNPMAVLGLPWTAFMTVGGWYIHELVRCPDGKWRSRSLRQEIAYMSIFKDALKYAILLVGLVILTRGRGQR